MTAANVKDYGVVVIAERSASIPPLSLRGEASRLRRETEDRLVAQSVIIGGEGFFASSMHGVMTGILAVARSRVPIGMVGSDSAAAGFLAGHLERPDVTAVSLTATLGRVRRLDWRVALGVT